MMILGDAAFNMAIAANTGSPPFEGAWDCDGSEVTPPTETYIFGRQPTLTISEGAGFPPRLAGGQHQRVKRS